MLNILLDDGKLIFEIVSTEKIQSIAVYKVENKAKRTPPTLYPTAVLEKDTVVTTLQLDKM
jgi:hypothetical protein